MRAATYQKIYNYTTWANLAIIILTYIVLYFYYYNVKQSENGNYIQISAYVFISGMLLFAIYMFVLGRLSSDDYQNTESNIDNTRLHDYHSWFVIISWAAFTVFNMLGLSGTIIDYISLYWLVLISIFGIFYHVYKDEDIYTSETIPLV